jgi:hypothetical protein
MQQPFPALTSLRLGAEDKRTPFVPVPASFLGGSAPRLQTLDLDHIPFPGVLKLLLSATHLIHLSLLGISRSGYISPEAMLDCLSVLTRLEILLIGFKSAQSFPHWESRISPLPTRTLFPVFSSLWFQGVSDYLEVLVAIIDAPVLDSLDVTFFNQIFDTPQLTQLISRTPKFKAYNHAQMVFSESEAWVILSQAFDSGIDSRIACRSQPDEQVSTLVQICSSSFPQAFISTVEHLYVLVCGDWDDIENDQWLDLLRPFTGAKALYILLEFVLSLPLALQELDGERVTEVLPALQTIFLEDVPPHSFRSGAEYAAIERIVAARQLAGHPITVSPWVIDDATEET